MGESEIEASLAICHRRPESVARRIASLQQLAGWTLVSGAPRCIRDTYLDTEEDALRAAGAALRVRRVDGRLRVAVKTRGRALEGGGVERGEREVPWSPGAIRELLSGLRETGVSLPVAGGSRAREGGRGTREESASATEARDGRAADPVSVARRMGLRVLQDRETLRRPSAVREEDGGRVAELVVDRVAFRPGGGTVLHYEVEVEAGDAGGTDTVQGVVSALGERFGARLRPWDHPKLATGEALRTLGERGSLEGITSPRGTLLPGAYDELESLLSASGAGAWGP
jgi:hypothetical protein